MCNAIAPIQPVTFSRTVALEQLTLRSLHQYHSKPALPPKTTDNAIKFAGQTSSIPGPNGIPRYQKECHYRTRHKRQIQQLDHQRLPSIQREMVPQAATVARETPTEQCIARLRQLNLQEPPHHDDYATCAKYTANICECGPNEVPMVDFARFNG